MLNISVTLKWQMLRTRLYFERLQLKMLLLPAIIFIFSTFTLTFSYANFQHLDLWAQWNLATGNAFHFCEMNHMDQLIRQPANTWSNLGFFLVGLFTLTLGIHDLKYTERKKSNNFLVRNPIFSIMFGLSSIYLFVGSFFYHASLTEFFQKLDQAGMCAVAIMVIVFNCYKIHPIFRFRGQYKSSHPIMIALGLGLNYLIYSTLYKININLLFPILVFIVFVTSCYYLFFISREHYFTNYLWAAFSILLFSTTIWIVDRTSVICNPVSIFQGHALWHVLNALSLLFIYLYYRSGITPLEEVIMAKEQRRASKK